MKHPATPPTMPQETLEALGRLHMPPPWRATLTEATGWNESTTRRLGRHPRFLADRNRLEKLISALARPLAHRDSAASFAAALEKFISDYDRNPGNDVTAGD